MSDESGFENSETDRKKTGIVMPLLIGLVLAAGLGAGGFYVTYSGMLGGNSGEADAAALHGAPPVAFVPIDPILVSLAGSGSPRHLRFRAQIETSPGQQDAIVAIMPRILDVLNSYLRAVSTEDLERETALIRLRAQMLRRIQLVSGDREVRDLLVTEFVLN
ncbi:flagellar basal body-associated protein FliL [Tropicimonas sp. IMCC6043]|uniref:flagellar basal body-associated FliL family protein n=1 Tax=Tropicimonas sp. IMCC6043 TaxID=2510645 RepID=UPI00101DFC02|nr:flagellar basal body-associated FliL family protein [Tropicimonas sp. IMCC6043]RYH09932.1 flagellar basal body protein FliL [Tropicimonas sp. IMCC6043]